MILRGWEYEKMIGHTVFRHIHHIYINIHQYTIIKVRHTRAQAVALFWDLGVFGVFFGRDGEGRTHRLQIQVDWSFFFCRQYFVKNSCKWKVWKPGSIKMTHQSMCSTRWQVQTVDWLGKMENDPKARYNNNNNNNLSLCT